MYHIHCSVIFSFWPGLVYSTVPCPESMLGLCSPPLPCTEPFPALLRFAIGDPSHAQHLKCGHGLYISFPYGDGFYSHWGKSPHFSVQSCCSKGGHQGWTRCPKAAHFLKLHQKVSWGMFSILNTMPPSLRMLFLFSAKGTTISSAGLPSVLMCLPAPGTSNHSSNYSNSSGTRVVSMPCCPLALRVSIYTHLQQVGAFKALIFPTM